MTYAKAMTALATAIAVFATVLPDGITGSEWCTVALAALGALGVYAVPNKVK